MIHVPIIHFKRYKKIGNTVSEVQLYLKVQKQDCNICTKTAISAKKKKRKLLWMPIVSGRRVFFCLCGSDVIVSGGQR